MVDSKKNLTIRFKLVLIVATFVCSASILMYVISSKVLLQSYTKIEHNATVENVRRVEDAIKNTNFQLGVKLADWASWDDTYNFIEDGNAEYIEVNLGNDSIKNLIINAMIFVNLDTSIRIAKVINYKTEEDINSVGITEHIANHPILTSGDAQTGVLGIISLPEGPMMVASRPILTSSSEGPKHGTLIFGKYLSDEVVSDLSLLTHLTFHVFPYRSTDLPPDVERSKSLLMAKDSVHVEMLSSNSVAGYSVIYDLYDEPVLVLRVTTDRPIYLQGTLTTDLLLALAIASFICFGVIVYIFISNMVIGRFFVLSHDVVEIGKNRDLSKKVTVGSNDEIGLVASTINTLLSELSKAQEETIKAQRLDLESSKLLEARSRENERVNKLMVDRELKMIELKKEIETLKGHV